MMGSVDDRSAYRHVTPPSPNLFVFFFLILFLHRIICD